MASWFTSAQETAQEMNIVVRETSQTASPMPADTTAAVKRDNETTKRELEGKAGDRDVNITIEEDGSTTRVEVTAKTSPVTWDKDFAKSVLEEILEKTKG
jgi:carbon monoxide dehydrogenase subunit G